MKFNYVKRPIYSLAPKMFDDWRRLDYLRQLFVTKGIVETLPLSQRNYAKYVVDAADLLIDVNRRLSEEDEIFLPQFFNFNASYFCTNLDSSARKDIPFDQRLDMNSKTWNRCQQSDCESIFPPSRVTIVAPTVGLVVN